MSVKLRASSGTYNVRASELARDRPVVKTVRCVVRFLDDTEAPFEIDVSRLQRSVKNSQFTNVMNNS